MATMAVKGLKSILANRTNGGAYATMLRPLVVCRRLSLPSQTWYFVAKR